jgi:hypothetical protein
MQSSSCMDGSNLLYVRGKGKLVELKRFTARISQL